MAKVAQLKSEPRVEMIPYSADTIKAVQIRIIIDSKTPLLTHNPESMGIAADAMKGGRIPSPEVEAEAGTYRMADGTCAFKGESCRQSTLAAAGAWKMKRTSARSRLAHITVVEELVPLMRRDGSPISDYVIDRRRAIVQKQGIIRCRPRFDEWSAMFTFMFDPLLVPDPKLIVDIMQDAGNRIGIGDYRPARNGWFGRFDVRSYAVMD